MSSLYHDSTRIYLWQHTRRHPGKWFTVTELTRVVYQQYIGQSYRREGGRVETVKARLAELEERGDVVSRDGGRLWSAGRAV